MAYLKKVPKGWSAQVEKHGLRKSKTFDLKAQAQAWANKLEAELDLQTQTGTKVSTLTFHGLLDRFALDECDKRKGGPTEKKRLEAFKKHLPDCPLRMIDASVLSEWRDKRLGEIKPGSVRREMSLMRTVLDVARREWRLFAVNPLTDVRKPKTPPARKRLITQAEADAVVWALNYREGLPVVQVGQKIAVMFLISIETGMRAGEIPRCVVNGSVAHLSTTKNDDSRDVPLSKRARELFALVPEWDINDGTRDTMFRLARKKAGLSGFTFHDARALALTRLSKKLDVIQLARMIGHRDPRSLMIYYRESASDIADKLG